MNFMNHQMANSGCQGQIEDEFWEEEEEPLDIFIEDHIDEVKVNERGYGRVPIICMGF